MGKLDDYTKDGYWEVTSFPAVVDPHRMRLQDMESLVSKSQARHRGWPFPFFKHDETLTMHTDHMQSITIAPNVLNFEGFRLYENGLFYWKGSMWENFSADYKKGKLSYVNLNWKITEMLLFLKRLYEEILDVEDVVNIRIQIVGCKGRVFHDDMEYCKGWYFGSTHCDEDNIILEKSVNYSTLKATWQEIACEFIQKVCVLFKLHEIREENIVDLQNRLLQMKMI